MINPSYMEEKSFLIFIVMELTELSNNITFCGLEKTLPLNWQSLGSMLFSNIDVIRFKPNMNLGKVCQ
jgi:hypothetical protein